jgi:hypothetical protein
MNKLHARIDLLKRDAMLVDRWLSDECMVSVRLSDDWGVIVESKKVKSKSRFLTASVVIHDTEALDA